MPRLARPTPPGIAAGLYVCLLLAAPALGQSPPGGAQADKSASEEALSEQALSEEASTQHAASVRRPEPRPANRLLGQASPYLQQHAHNPVNWYPWGPQPLAKARAEGKPIFLSIGYSTCYWCHVMERESFEDPEVAQFLNEHFVCIKVDREELPDVDQHYMLATQLITGRGGWPNSLWLTPDGRPWMAGTYFPRPQFLAALQQLVQAWETRQPEIQQQATSLLESIERIGNAGFHPRPITQTLVDQGLSAAAANYDSQQGGFSAAPKFPPHAQLALLIAHVQRSQERQLWLEMIETTLTHMARSGMCDQLAGGFHRYATDSQWHLPHFEKMLYDNAQLLKSYASGWRLTGNPEHRVTAHRIFQWVRDEMTAPGGGFYTAIDSESLGREGEYYTWHYDELLQILGTRDGRRFAEIYQVTRQGNFAEEASGRRTGANVLHRQRSIADWALHYGWSPHALARELATQQHQLLQHRRQRPPPRRDDKLITGWNGLMIEGLAFAGRQLEQPEWVQAAAAAADFMLEHMLVDGRLMRIYYEGQVQIAGTLDDYAYFLAGLIEVHRATSQPHYLQAAQQVADTALAEFEDAPQGGFFFTGSSPAGARVVEGLRSKHADLGGNLPSASGVLLLALYDLSDLSGQPRYAERADHHLRGLSGYAWRTAAHCDALHLAAMRYLDRSAGPGTPNAEAPNSGGTASDSPATADFVATGLQGQVQATRTKVAPGESFRVTVRCHIESPWHVYADNSPEELVIPTTIQLPANPHFELLAVHPPAAELLEDQAFGRQLQIYRGDIEFVAELRVLPAARVGAASLELTLHSQACDARQCGPPEQTVLRLPLMVVAPSTPSASSATPDRP